MAEHADAPDGQMNECTEAPPRSGASPAVRLTAAVSAVVAVAGFGLAGWLGFRAYQSHRVEQRQAMFLQAGRQGALNLTTIDHSRVDADVQRILESATGAFYSDFQQRSAAFAEVVKQARSKSEGTITEAGLESVTDDSGQVLVSVSVQTSNAGAADPAPRQWRMRIGLQQVGSDVKVSNVGFVP